jgi:serine/threonine protein kinase
MPDYSQYLGSVLNGSYRLDSLIRVGGMGAVYRGSHTRLPRQFAIKVLPLDSQANPELVIRFQREAEITAALQHPHIVQVTDYNVAEIGVPYLVMELLEGIDLRRQLAKHGLPDLRALRILLEQACPALAAAHQLGVVHRDLKPSNLFLCTRPQQLFHLKVLDFGVSKIVGAQSEVTSTQASIGTPRYMAPEQARGRAGEVDSRTDIFALCTMLYEMLTGKSPFAAESIPSMLYRIVHEDPEWLGDLRPDLPESLVQAIHRGMHKAREARYSSTDELWQVVSVALDEAIALGAGQPQQNTLVTGPDDSGPSRTGPPTSARADRTAWPTVATSGATPSAQAAMDAAPTRVHTGPTTPLPADRSALEQHLTGPQGPMVRRQEAQTRDTTLPRSDGQQLATHELTAIDTSPSFPGAPAGLPASAPPLPQESAVSAPLPLAPPPSAGPPSHPGLTGPHPDLDVGGRSSRTVILISAVATVAVAALVLVLVFALGGDPPETSAVDAGAGDLVSRQAARGQVDGAVTAGRPDARVARRADSAAEAPSTRRLVLTSRPSGARVTFAGKVLGRTPLQGVSIAVKAGSLRVKRPGYTSWTRAIPAGRAALRLSATLRRAAPRKGNLRVVTRSGGKMVWANLSVDGAAKGQTPRVLKVTAGKHRLRASRPGYGSATQVITVRGGGDQSVVLMLKKR